MQPRRHQRRAGAAAKKLYDDAVVEGLRRLPGTLLPVLQPSPPFQRRRRDKKGKKEEDKSECGAFVFWDFDTAPLPSGCAVENLKASINTSLQHYRKHYNLMKMEQVCVGFGDVREAFTPEDFASLKAQGFKLHHVVKRRFNCKRCGKLVPPQKHSKLFIYIYGLV